MGDVPTQLIRFRRIWWDTPRGGVDFGEDEVRQLIRNDAIGEIESHINRSYGKGKQYARQNHFLGFARGAFRYCGF
jgi:hypothetical protein